MRNLRKLTAAVLAVAIVLTTMTAAFAATDATAPVNNDKAIVLNQLGLYAGTSTTEFVPDLGAKLTRQQATVMLLKMFGLADKAAALKDEEVATALKAYTDADKVASWAKKSIAYAVSNNIMSGVSATTIDPAANVTGAQYATLIVKSMGYKVDDFKLAVTQLSKVTGSKVADEFADADLTRDGAVGYMFGALTAETADKTTVIANLVAENPAIKDAAVKAGLVADTAAAKALNVDTVAALNSKIVEVTLKDAATAADVTATTFAVKDSAAKEVKVVSSAIAPWSEKAVIVTLEADTTAGTLYTLTIADKAYNFGGRSKDTTKPEVSSITSDDYNQVTVEFTEAVDITTVKAEFAEMYGSKTVLNITDKKYDGNNKIVFTTDTQKAYTLYGSAITGVADLSGNVVDYKKDTITFTGTGLNTDEQEIVNVKSNNPEEATIEFKVKVDTKTIAAANFKVEEAYGSKTVLAVTDARLANKDELAIDGFTQLTDKTKLTDVVLTIPGMKSATLYKVTATGVKTLYGKDLKTDKNTATFGGTAKPTEPYKYTVDQGKATSNTLIKVVFDNKVVKADAENIANYAIVEAYGTSPAVLAITKAVLKDDSKTVELTTASMKTALYKITITGIKDAWGNAIKTADSANTVSFSGVSVADKITKIKEIAYVSGSETVIEVTFDQNVGATKTDVSHYSIDNSIGYPTKAAAGTNDNQVKLTIPKLTTGTPYTITVKGLENADGVAMATDGVKGTFIGKGNTAGLPEIVAVMPTDNQTIKVFFDREVTENKVAGPIWDKDNKQIVAGALSYIHNANVTTALDGAYAYQDSDNKSALVIRIATAKAFDSANVDATLKSFKLVGLSTKFKADKNSLIFTYNPNDPTAIIIDGVNVLNRSTVRVYFNQAVYGSLIEFATINVEKATSSTFNVANDITFVKAVVVPGTGDKVYDFTTSANLATKSYWLNNAALNNPDVISDTVVGYDFGFVGLKDEDTNAAGVQHYRQFAGSDAAAGDLKNVSIMMLDAKTILVYYGENMDVTAGTATSAINPLNYTITDKAGTTLVTMADGTAFDNANDIGEVTFETDTTKSTLYAATIKLNQAIKTVPADGIYLKIASTVKNANGTKNVVDGTNVICKQFAISTAAPAKVKIKEASLTGSTLTITFDSKVTTAYANAAAFLADFGINLTRTTTSGAVDLVAADIASVTNITKADKITINLAVNPVDNQPCKITIKTENLKSAITNEPTEKDNTLTVNTAE